MTSTKKANLQKMTKRRYNIILMKKSKVKVREIRQNTTNEIKGFINRIPKYIESQMKLGHK